MEHFNCLRRQMHIWLMSALSSCRDVLVPVLSARFQDGTCPLTWLGDPSLHWWRVTPWQGQTCQSHRKTFICLYPYERLNHVSGIFHYILIRAFLSAWNFRFQNVINFPLFPLGSFDACRSSCQLFGLFAPWSVHCAILCNQKVKIKKGFDLNNWLYLSRTLFSFFLTQTGTYQNGLYNLEDLRSV